MHSSNHSSSSSANHSWVRNPPCNYQIHTSFQPSCHVGTSYAYHDKSFHRKFCRSKCTPLANKTALTTTDNMHTHQTALLSLLQTEPNGITMHAILYVCYLLNNPSFEVYPIHPSTSDANTCKSKNIQLHVKPSMKPTYLSSTSGKTNSQHHRHSASNIRTHHAFLDANNTTQALEADYSQTIRITHHSFKQLKSYN